jgi:hypothetical protein
MAKKQHWKPEPDAHDYSAAAAYLSLVLTAGEVKAVVTRLQAAPITYAKAKDLLRATGLPHLPLDNVHVAVDLEKVKTGRKLSPVLLLRGRLASSVPLTVADGYHRICASYSLDEDADIPCRIADLDAP